MLYGDFLFFFFLASICVWFLVLFKQYSRVRAGYRLLTIGLALASLSALIDFLIIGPSHLLPFEIRGEVAVEFWRIFGYMPGLVLILLGTAKILPAVGRISDEIVAREETGVVLQTKADEFRDAKLRAEKAEAILVEALEAISEAFIIFDADDRVVAFNTQHKNLFDDVEDVLKPGVTFEELIHHQTAATLHFENPGEAERWIKQRMKEHRNPEGSRDQVFNGDRIYRLTERRTPSGGTVAIRTDITDLRMRERALGNLNERLEEAQSVAHIGHWSVNVADEKHEWSDEVSRIMGYDPKTIEICKEAYHSRVHPEDILGMRSVVNWALENIENYQTEYRMIRPDGEIVHVREIGRFQTDETGNVEFYRGTIQDISAEHFTELELIDAKMRAEEGTKAKSLFLASMSHELRTPLNAVIGFADVISKEIFGPLNNQKYKEYTENILSSGQHLLSLINDILDYSRFEAGKYELENEEVSFKDVIGWTELLLSPKAHEKSIDLSFHLDTDLIFMGDKRKFKQVMVNLINNAIKFTPVNGAVKTYVRDDAEKYISIFVEDNGIGIGKDELGTVLKPFVRARNSVSHSIEGTGLGLPLSKSIVELHGGVLEIESAEDAGTTVEIRLPRNRLVEMQKRA